MNAQSSHQVLAFQVVDKENALLAVRVTKHGRDNEFRKLEKKLPGFTVVAGSAVKLPYASTIHDMYRVTIARKIEMVEATPAELARRVCLSSNMFMSRDDDSVWDRNGDVLVRKNHVESAEHLQQLLASSLCDAKVQNTRESRDIGRVMASSLPEVVGGMYAVFNIGDQLMDGFVVATYEGSDEVLVLPRPDDTSKPYPEHKIRAASIVAAFDLEKETPGKVPVAKKELEALATSASLPTASQALDYYKKVYGYNPEYWRKWSAMLRERGFYR